MKTYALRLPLLFVLLTGALAGCDGTRPDALSESRIRILLTDAPDDEIVEAHVVIERVELRGAGEKVVLLNGDPQPFDLLTLQDGVTATLADLDVPDGTYHQVRLFVRDEASVVFDDGTEENLKVPGGDNSGIKIQLPQLEINSDVVEVTIDFDLNASFVKRGNSGKGYIFKPVLKPISLLVNGEPVALPDSDGDAAAR